MSLKSITAGLAALAAVFLLVVAAPSAHADTAGTAAQFEKVGTTITVAGNDAAAATVSCDQPCWPDCLNQLYPCWQMWTKQYLTANPVEDMNTSCLSGRLYLGAGHYDWGAILTGQGIKLWQNLYLGAGWYGMDTCMDPHNNSRYTHSINLYPDNPAWHPIHVEYDIAVVQSGEYQWGAYLDPLF